MRNRRPPGPSGDGGFQGSTARRRIIYCQSRGGQRPHPRGSGKKYGRRRGSCATQRMPESSRTGPDPRQDCRQVHVNHAGGGTVNSWRHRTERRIARLKRAGSAVAAMDGAFFIHNDSAGRKYWFPVGTPVRVTHVGGGEGETQDADGVRRSHGRRKAVLQDGHLRPQQRDVHTVRQGPLAPLQKGGAAIGQGADAPLDTGEEGIWQKQKCRVHLPARGPAVPQRLGAMLARGKNDLLNPKYYETFGNMRRAVSTYLRTIRFDLDVHKYLNGKTSEYA